MYGNMKYIKLYNKKKKANKIKKYKKVIRN